jgi:hypothetical protein
MTQNIKKNKIRGDNSLTYPRKKRRKQHTDNNTTQQQTMEYSTLEVSMD